MYAWHLLLITTNVLGFLDDDGFIRKIKRTRAAVQCQPSEKSVLFVKDVVFSRTQWWIGWYTKCLKLFQAIGPNPICVWRQVEPFYLLRGLTRNQITLFFLHTYPFPLQNMNQIPIAIKEEAQDETPKMYKSIAPSTAVTTTKPAASSSSHAPPLQKNVPAFLNKLYR